MAALIFDSHCHYDDRAFDEDRYELLDRLLVNEGHTVDKMLHAAVDEKSSLFGIETAQRYENYYTSIGFHPEYADDVPDNYMELLTALYEKAEGTGKLRAVGEIGLDHHYEGYNAAKQAELFVSQVKFANEKGLPIIVHCRDATEECMRILSELRPAGVMHCFSGSAETAEEVVGLGMYVGFTGSLAFKNNKKAKRACEAVPIERLLLETDCPYMAPPPYRGERSESSMIAETAKVMAEVKGVTADEILRATNENACRLFGIAPFAR
ncbi:TatD family hydrolase [Ruminococcus sp.]|uniref:TatD family hydrolase n=1 Tax=Ruminococcus sp. TaxID=41978 RepID=UPI0025879406|nr:TatD family hydrolase [Ruminococcus sp.]MCR5022644.1 TatD family hydrolase [Ruminococcus sp.]